MDMTDDSAKDNDLGREAESSHRLNREMARIGRALFGYLLEIGLGVTAIAAPFVHPTLAKKPSELALKAIGLCLVLNGLSVRAWAAGFAGRHTRRSEIEGNKIGDGLPLRSCSQSHLPWERHFWVRKVLVIRDRRLLVTSSLTFLVLYFG